jgi:hypothetical protein
LHGSLSLSLSQMGTRLAELRSLECSVISPLRVLYFSTQNIDVRAGSLKILLHVLEVICYYHGLINFAFFLSQFSAYS